ncbi:4'-phosphopantetheinyl transferase superfamily protein [Neisseriaceae bacterium TC5R-5]|nr:4'-phosphopantetheinyl transferase superfamily protein [Neisseriaceae bacterium TC5R-5]
MKSDLFVRSSSKRPILKLPLYLPIPLSHTLVLAEGNPLLIQLIHFDIGRFSLTAFAEAGIDCPPNILSSVKKRQAEFFYGRLAAKWALREFDLQDSQISIGQGREPCWPAGMIGSISHSSDLAGAIVARRGQYIGIGIDIEHTVTAEMKEALLKLAINQDELALLQAAPGCLPLNTRITLLFSAKESLFKAAYGSVQRFFDFDAAQLVHLDITKHYLILRLNEHLNDMLPFNRHCRISFSLLEEGTVLTAFALSSTGFQEACS